MWFIIVVNKPKMGSRGCVLVGVSVERRGRSQEVFVRKFCELGCRVLGFFGVRIVF